MINAPPRERLCYVSFSPKPLGIASRSAKASPLRRLRDVRYLSQTLHPLLYEPLEINSSRPAHEVKQKHPRKYDRGTAHVQFVRSVKSRHWKARQRTSLVGPFQVEQEKASPGKGVVHPFHHQMNTQRHRRGHTHVQPTTRRKHLGHDEGEEGGSYISSHSNNACVQKIT